MNNRKLRSCNPITCALSPFGRILGQEPLYEGNNMFSKHSFNEIDSLCRRKISSLEFWLRRLIHDTLNESYGEDYFNASTSKGHPVINKQIATKARKKFEERAVSEPGRYQRQVDTLLLEDVIAIICRVDLYKDHFKPALMHAFPQGNTEAKVFLDRIAEGRNPLAHANPISLRKAERVICYSNDITDSLQQYYKERNLAEQFNIPKVVSIRDSLGNSKTGEVLRGNPERDTNNFHVFFNEKDHKPLYVGDTLTIEVQVDPAFEEGSYKVDWYYPGFISDDSQQPTGSKISVELTNEQVGAQFHIQCRVISDKPWHRLNGCDDDICIMYTVLPR